MKILKVEFQNINSLKGTHQIDFTAPPFTTNSLFAITGPTGSGKSTILDVISLALFNHIPRLGKISKNEIISKGAILTKNQKEAYAKVTYTCKAGIYSSTWSISTARTGSLRDYEMEIAEEATGNLLDLKKSDVPAKNEELIGLNYNQFIKSVLLAQGEFAQFLKAKKEERGEMLEKITGTGIYRQLGKLAYEKYKSVNKEIQNQQDEIALIKRDLIEEEQLVDLTEEYSKKDKICKPLAEEINILAKKLDLKKTIEEQLEEINKVSAEREAVDTDLKKFDTAYGFQLNQHDKVRDVADDLRNWGRLAKECANLDEDFRGKTHKKNTTARDLEDCLKKVSGFTKLEVEQEEVEIRLEEYSLKVRTLQEKLNNKLTEFKNLQNQFRTETRDLPCSLDEKNPEATLKLLKELQISSAENIKQLKEALPDMDLDEPEAERSRLKRHMQEAREAQHQAVRIGKISAEIQRLEKEEERLVPLLKNLPQEIRHDEDQVKIYKEKLENINLKRENQLLLAGLEDHRIKLKKGEPCPLCGAVHHPYAGDLPEKDNELDSQMKVVERELAKWTSKLNGDSTTLKHYQKDLEEFTKQKNTRQNELKIEKDALTEKYQHLHAGAETNWQDFFSDLDVKIENLEKFQKENRSRECVETGLPIIEKMMKISSEGKILRENLHTIYSGQDIHKDSQILQTRWTQVKELEKAINEQLQELQVKVDRSKKELTNLEEELTHRVTEKGFENIATAGEALLPDPEYFKLRTHRDKIEKEIARNQNSLKILNEQLEKSKALDVEQSIEELLEQQQEKNSTLENIQKECQHLQRILLNDKDNRVRLKKIGEEISEKEKHIYRWKILDKLIGDSQGKKFNDFAQDLSLGHLIQLANLRLKDLSDRYSIDKPLDEEDDGLVAIDEHMGGQRRSVKTLSGGETFILSLSMALALSDLASRNVEINSLFIDEGFGTLDPETLDQTLDTLEKLQAESSKTIGIISHVEALKERIATQIQLKRNGQGYSSLEVK